MSDRIFKALADSTRRALLDRLFSEPGQTLGHLCSGQEMSRQAVSKHLAILEEAELVVVQWHGREKHYYLNPLPIHEISERWLDKFSAGKAAALLRLRDALEANEGEDP